LKDKIKPKKSKKGRRKNKQRKPNNGKRKKNKFKIHDKMEGMCMSLACIHLAVNWCI
jgi:hypothetical protein